MGYELFVKTISGLAEVGNGKEERMMEQTPRQCLRLTKKVMEALTSTAVSVKHNHMRKYSESPIHNWHSINFLFKTLLEINSAYDTIQPCKVYHSMVFSIFSVVNICVYTYNLF